MIRPSRFRYPDLLFTNIEAALRKIRVIRPITIGSRGLAAINDSKVSNFSRSIFGGTDSDRYFVDGRSSRCVDFTRCVSGL